ncbi:MAG: SDR family NAD(P)-dependent oxidoreductase [Bacteroidetes bacterium]|nr:SDR family NAD(P)-dependent oxidoreductase [Bacteroidota bacterium]
MIELFGKTALVTGATGGMGREITLALAREGARLVLMDYEQSRLDALKLQIEKEYSVDVRSICLDLSGQIEKEAAEISASTGPVDILVYTAGTITPNLLEAVDSKEYEQQFNINFQSAWYLVRAMLSGLKERKGQIVMISSSIIMNAKADLSVYTASKHALAGFTESLRQEVNSHGVRVVNIVPGKTATPLLEKLSKNAGQEYDSDKLLQPYDIACTVLHVLKLPLTAEITDLHIRSMRK